MTKQEQFFYDHAGYSFAAATETAEDGRTRGAKALARAEEYAEEKGWYILWGDDGEADFQEEDGSWSSAPAVSAALMENYYAENASTCLASLGGIMESDDATERNNYRRVIAAELADETMAA